MEPIENGIILNQEFESINYFYVFEVINKTKFSNHSANKICWNDEGHMFAVRCNCGKKVYHPVFNNKVYWEEKIAGKNLVNLIRLSLVNIYKVLAN